MNRRLLLAVAMWLAAAVVAVLTGLAAVRVIGEGITAPAGAARDPQDVARALAGAPEPQQWPFSQDPTGSAPASTAPGGGRAAVPRATTGPGSPGATRPARGPAFGGSPQPRPSAGSTTPATAGARPGATSRPPAGPTARPRPVPTAPRPPATTTTLRTPGGSIVARCTGGQVQLTSWAPAQGYATHAVHRGPDDEAEIRFRGRDGEVRVTVVCGRTGPVATWRIV